MLKHFQWNGLPVNTVAVSCGCIFRKERCKRQRLRDFFSNAKVIPVFFQRPAAGKIHRSAILYFGRGFDLIIIRILWKE